MKLLVISSYPEKNQVHGTKTVGVASYTKNTLKNIRQSDSNIDIEVCAEIFNNPEKYTDDSEIIVNRIWERNSILSQLKLVNYIRRNSSKKVLAQFEMFMMGNSLFALFYLLSLYLVRIFGKEIILVVHQVINDPSIFEKNILKKYFYKISMSLFYYILIHSSNKIVVFEEELKNRLYRRENIIVIPHAVESFQIKDSKEDTRKMLNLDLDTKYILYFGYLAEYKGVDDLISLYDANSKYKIVIAGGENPNHVNNPAYRNFIDKIESEAKDKNIEITGFINEDDIAKYFIACDLLILPYKTFMSSSGPLSIAYSFSLPILMSESLEPYTLTTDFQKSLRENNISINDLLFNSNNFSKKVENIFNFEEKFSKFSSDMKNARSWKVISKEYIKLLK